MRCTPRELEARIRRAEAASRARLPPPTVRVVRVGIGETPAEARLRELGTADINTGPVLSEDGTPIPPSVIVHLIPARDGKPACALPFPSGRAPGTCPAVHDAFPIAFDSG